MFTIQEESQRDPSPTQVVESNKSTKEDKGKSLVEKWESKMNTLFNGSC